MLEDPDSNIQKADILIVDDESANLRLLSGILGREGYHLRPANSPKLALESALKNPPKLVLLDVKMPGMNGFEVCEALKQNERTRDIPVLFISDLHDTRDKVRGFEVGGVDYITKPIQEEEVLARVRAHMKLRNMQSNSEKLADERTAELIESEQLARKLLNAATDLIHLIDEDGTILDLNYAMVARLGGTREELIGKCVYDFFPQEAAKNRRDIVQQALAVGKPTLYLDRNSPNKVFETGIYPVETPTGEKGRIVILARDATEREEYNRRLQEREAALQQKVQQMRKIIDTVPAYIFAKDIDGRFLLANKAVGDLFGVDDPEQVFGKTDYDYGATEEQVRNYNMFDWSIIASNESLLIPEEQVLRKDGTLGWFQTTKVPYQHPGYDKPATLGIAVEITDRKEAEQALKESEARFRATFEQAAVGIAHVGPDGSFLRVNKRFCAIIGYDEAETLEKRFHDITHPDDLEVDVKHVDRLIREEGDTYTIEKRYIRKDAAIVWCSLTVSSVRDEDGLVSWFVAVIQDITERKKMEGALKENEEKLRTAQQLARLGYWEFDLAEDQLTWSNEMYRIYDINPDTAVSFDTLLGKVHPNDQEYQRQLLDDLITGKSVPPFDYRIFWPDGSIRYLYGMAMSERDGQNAVFRIKGTLQDVTEMKMVEMAYRESETHLKQAQSETMKLRLEMAHLNRIMTMNELASSFAHELNQPLGAIVNNAAVARTLQAQSGKEDEEFEDILSDIGNDAQRAGQIIRKIRGVMTKGDAEYASLDLNLLLDEAITLYQNIFNLKHVSVVVEKAPDLAPVKGDKVQLQQVLMNLITNSIDAMENSSQKVVEFKTLQGDNETTVSVSDTGKGIDTSSIEDIFDPFYTTKREGMGIGLRICRSIIEEHGGQIWVENNRGAGTTFYFTLKIRS